MKDENPARSDVSEIGVLETDAQFQEGTAPLLEIDSNGQCAAIALRGSRSPLRGRPATLLYDSRGDRGYGTVQLLDAQSNVERRTNYGVPVETAMRFF